MNVMRPFFTPAFFRRATLKLSRVGSQVGLTSIGVALLLSACTDRDIMPIAEAPKAPFDDKLALSGKVCTEDPAALEFPLKVFFIIDTSQSMNVNDPRRTAPDPELGETTIVDPTQSTGRSRAVRSVVTQFIDLGVQYPPIYCNTGQPNCDKGSTTCPACASVAPAMCIGADCCPCGAEGPLASGCQNVPCCPPATEVNALCLPQCAEDSDCPNQGSRCLSGICSKLLDPGVEFAFLRFGSARQVLTRTPNGDPGFTNDPQELVTALPQINNGGSVTDYEGALNEAFATISADIRDAQRDDSGAINRTKYVVVMLSDGQPDPAVNDREDWDNIDPQLISDMLGENAAYYENLTSYNVSNNILRRVRDIMSLKALYGLGDIRFHTAFLTGPTTPAHKQEQAIFLLKQMAQIGKGTFRNFANGEAINFLHVDFSSLRRVFQLKNLIATNLNARTTGLTTYLDSDGDGLQDELEIRNGTNVSSLDTDTDGFSDTLEYFFRTSGADALDPQDSDCSFAAGDLDGDGKLDDTDGDGLFDCEERFLGTNRNQFDSDADGVPDNLEVRFNTNPVADDSLDDLDFDGMPNGDELRLHTDPIVDDAANRSRISYRYDVTRVGTGIELRGLTCTEDADCPSGTNCIDSYCRCTTTDDCSTLEACSESCTRVDETCEASACRSVYTCEEVADIPAAPAGQNTCAKTENITCYNYRVENITLVDPKGKVEDGWNTVYLYFGQAPFDNPEDSGVFSMACIRARFNAENGAKLPATGDLTVPETAWRDPRLFNSDTDCLCPDGQLGSCPAP